MTDYFLRSPSRTAFIAHCAASARWLLARDRAGAVVLRGHGGGVRSGFLFLEVGAVTDKPPVLALDDMRLQDDIARDVAEDKGRRRRSLDAYLSVAVAAKRNPAWHANLRVWGDAHQALAAAGFGRDWPNVVRVFPNSPSHVWFGDAIKPATPPAIEPHGGSIPSREGRGL